MRSGMDTVTGRSEPQDPCKVGMEALPGSDCNRSEYAIPFRIQSILEKNERGATDVSAVACPSTGAMHPQSTGTTHAKHFDDELRQAVASFRYGLITDLVHYPPGTPGIGDRLRENTEHP